MKSPARWPRSVITIATFAAAVTLWSGLLQGRAWLDAAHDFDGVAWELASFPGKWLYAFGAPVREDPAPDVALAGYFATRDRNSADSRHLEGPVEAAIEGRLDAALRDLGLPRLFDVSAWPPVNIELTAPPGVLAISPRDRIRLESARPLRSDVTGEAAAALEREVEAASAGRVAVVVPLGGISTYPAAVTDGASYASTVQVAAHEWVHHYFAFSALGWRTLTSREALTINETAADLAGAEIAAVVLQRFGDPTAAIASDGGASRTRAADLARARAERDATLRGLRLEVDQLLAAGRVDEAERRMEEVRLDLEAHGFLIRRLNQAYFAWYGTYAARADSIDPLGAQLRELRRASGSLARFLELAGGATSRAEVARLLESLGGVQAEGGRP